ncbi:GNAT family N-acetyltransferase [Flectobacillus sp. BAB-3569]|uniref:GNAT family N-acetyltransferase n=1 Tax=Flectobacillus sp. BAB-3569 TaxID=1509483 RepID=UPI001E489FAC|nr:GNAT family N-acetyltransferase [Flectobacillus sp. BAB-3569]
MQISYRQGSVEDILSISAGIPEFENLYAKEVYQERFEHSPKHLILVAYDEDMPVGFKAGYQKNNDGSFYSWMGAVLPAYRKQKIAKNLADQMEDWAKKKGIRALSSKLETI